MKARNPLIGAELRLSLTMTDARMMLVEHESRMTELQHKLRHLGFKPTPEQYNAVFEVMNKVDSMLTEAEAVLGGVVKNTQTRGKVPYDHTKEG
jgi:hypothetical protein